MKKIISAFLLFSLYGGCLSAQVPYNQTKKEVIYTEVVNVPHATKDVLFDRAMTTLGTIYNTLEKKIETKDKANGLIELKCMVTLLFKDEKSGVMVPGGYIKYKVKLQFKDGKYRYQFYDFHKDKGGYRYGIEHYVLKDETVNPADRGDEVLKQVNDEITGIIAKLKSGMTADKIQKKSDW